MRHDPPPATVDLAVFPTAQNEGGAGGGVICETKRIRSRYLLLEAGQASPDFGGHPIVKGVRRRAQGNELIPDPRPLTPATFMTRLCALVEMAAVTAVPTPRKASRIPSIGSFSSPKVQPELVAG